MELTSSKIAIIMLSLEARINELNKRIENFEWYIANKTDDEYKTDMQQALPELKNELAETIALLREMEEM